MSKPNPCTTCGHPKRRHAVTFADTGRYRKCHPGCGRMEPVVSAVPTGCTLCDCPHFSSQRAVAAEIA